MDKKTRKPHFITYKGKTCHSQSKMCYNTLCKRSATMFPTLLRGSVRVWLALLTPWVFSYVRFLLFSTLHTSRSTLIYTYYNCNTYIYVNQPSKNFLNNCLSENKFFKNSNIKTCYHNWLRIKPSNYIFFLPSNIIVQANFYRLNNKGLK